jgi:hypothetical protein
MFQTEVLGKIKTHFIYNDYFLKIVTVYDIMWNNMVQLGKPEVAMRCRKDAICMPDN